jgi:hypothetical protein
MNKGQKILISTGLQPGEDIRNHREAVLTAFANRDNPLKRVYLRDNWIHPAEAGC